MKGKRRKGNTPRRLRLHRNARLRAAILWIPTYQGKNLLKGYCRWFGVDLVCAVAEFRILDIPIDESKVSQALATRESLLEIRRKKKEDELYLADLTEFQDVFDFF